MRLILLCSFVLLMTGSQGQLIQNTIKSGSDANKVDVFIRPDFNNSLEYLFQLQFTIAFPSTVTPLPSGLTITLHPTFVTQFVGSTYNVVVNPMGENAATSERYFAVTLTRNAGTPAANSMAQSWVLGTEYPVFSANFNSPTSPPAQSQVKIADYQSGGSDGQGNTFSVNGTGTYYYDGSDSRNNFYGTGGQSVAGGAVEAGFAQTVALVSLPASLLNFSGVKNGSKNVLRWTTANENNNSGFAVQRSLDGVNYSQIGFVDSRAPGGTSSTNLNYTFDDNSPVGKKQYYRLQQIDADGRAKLSNIVLLQGDKPLSVGIGGIFPNPASELVNVIIDAPKRDDVTLVVMDAGGKTVKQKLVNVEIGSNTVPVEINNLAAGSYVVKVVCRSTDCQEAVSKFVKQ